MDVVAIHPPAVLQELQLHNLPFKSASRLNIRSTDFQKFPGGMPPDPLSNSVLSVVNTII